jgi:hypothetical protein
MKTYRMTTLSAISSGSHGTEDGQNSWALTAQRTGGIRKKISVNHSLMKIYLQQKILIISEESKAHALFDSLF